MILAAGLSPAWQEILVFDQLRTGEVNRARESHWCASGKVLNVAVAARALVRETSVAAISVLGGTTGNLIEEEFRSLGVQLSKIETRAATRVCTTLLDRQTGVTTELVENARAMLESEWEEYLAEFQRIGPSAEICVFTGSLPQGAPADFLPRLNDAAACRWLLDIRGEDLMSLLPRKPWLVKPNREELAATFQRDLTREENLQQAMRELLDLGGESVLITRGNAAAMLAFGDETWRFTPPKVATVNPIGCGDSLAAGIAVATQEGGDLVEAVRFGIAAAAHNAELLLPARLNRSRVEDLVRSVRVERIP